MWGGYVQRICFRQNHPPDSDEFLRPLQYCLLPACFYARGKLPAEIQTKHHPRRKTGNMPAYDSTRLVLTLGSQLG